MAGTIVSIDHRALINSVFEPTFVDKVIKAQRGGYSLHLVPAIVNKRALMPNSSCKFSKPRFLVTTLYFCISQPKLYNAELISSSKTLSGVTW